MEEKKKKVKAPPKLLKEGGVKKATDKDMVPDEVHLKDIYAVYGMWRYFPAAMRDLSETDLRTSFGLQDTEMVRILKLPTQGAFAKEFKVDEKTLWAWNKKLDKESILDWIALWARHSAPNVVLAMIQNAKGKGGTSFIDRQNYFKTIAGYEEKKTVKVEGFFDALLEDLKE